MATDYLKVFDIVGNQLEGNFELASSIVGAGNINVETINANKTLLASDAKFQFLTPTVPVLTVNLPASPNDKQEFFIWNGYTGTAINFQLNISVGARTDKVAPGNIKGWIYDSGAAKWFPLSQASANSGANNLTTAIGTDANAIDSVSVGATTFSGNESVAVGNNSQANDQNIAIGDKANAGNYERSQAIGYNSQVMRDYDRTTHLDDAKDLADGTSHWHAKSLLNAFSTEIFLDGSSSRFTLNVGTSIYMEIWIFGSNTTHTESGIFKTTCHAYRDNLGTTVNASTVNTVINRTSGFINAVTSVDTVNHTIEIFVDNTPGVGSETFNWQAKAVLRLENT